MKWLGEHTFSSENSYVVLIIVFLMNKNYSLGENCGPRCSSFRMILDIFC